jgi:hypothetical protein
LSWGLSRAIDYLQASCDDDRRYLLFNAAQKARVSTGTDPGGPKAPG